MSKTDQTSGSRPLRKRKSKRFDRSGETPRVAGSAPDVDIDDDVDTGVDIDTGGDVGAQVDGEAESAADAGAATATAVVDEAELDTSTAEAGGQDGDAPVATGESTETPADAAGEEAPVKRRKKTRRAPLLTKEPTRSRTLGERDTCGRCGHEVSMINIEVDGTVLIMESCDNCDTRRWHLAGEQIDLQQALDHVGEHAGRRR